MFKIIKQCFKSNIKYNKTPILELSRMFLFYNCLFSENINVVLARFFHHESLKKYSIMKHCLMVIFLHHERYEKFRKKRIARGRAQVLIEKEILIEKDVDTSLCDATRIKS